MGTGHAWAECASDIVIEDELTCSSSIDGLIDHEAESLLGGTCDDGLCYTCGEPHEDEEQTAPEAVYSFTCQLAGEVTMLITNLPCDLDMYVLDDSCDPYAGCLYGSTASYAVDDQVVFTCSTHETYYIVVEAYGTDHLENASGPCTDTEDAYGEVYSPTYTLSFDVSESRGCNEDCDDGLDNDLDEYTDCDDSDCMTDPICCDLDDDDVFSEECGGDDCDDEDASLNTDDADGDGYSTCDGDCDDDDADLNLTDADGDGFTTCDGDCDDNDATAFPGAEDVPSNDVDEDCDGEDSVVDSSGDTGATEADPIDNESGKTSDKCGCASSTTKSKLAFGLVMLVPLLARRRR